MEQDPPFRVFNCTNNSLRNTKIQHHLTVCRCCVGAIDILHSKFNLFQAFRYK